MSPAAGCAYCGRRFLGGFGAQFCSPECKDRFQAHEKRDAAELRRVMDARLAKATGRAK